MPLAAGVAKSLGKRIAKATTEAGEISGRLTAHLSEILKASKMIRIYQKREIEYQKSKYIITEMVNKSAKIASIIIRATPNGNFNRCNDSWIYILFGNVNF